MEINRLDIVKELRNVDDVLKMTDSLVSDGTLHRRAKKEVQAKKTRTQKILVLIKHLKKRVTTSSGLKSFLQRLQSAGYGDLAERIRKS